MTTDWFDGRVARSRGRSSPLGSLLDPVADKLLVLTVLIVLVGRGIFPGWMVAAIVAREFLVSGLRLAALERGVVMHARDLGKLKTWSQATAAAIGGFAAAGAWHERVAWWALLVALVLTWLSGLDYARVAPGLLRGRAVAALEVLAEPRSAQPRFRQTLLSVRLGCNGSDGMHVRRLVDVLADSRVAPAAAIGARDAVLLE
jgi:CDP-diacylglycerol--glycerol-3-phosphate 3-phosphatidyltransferase